MPKDRRDLVREAVDDATALKDAALEAAKNQIIESLAPSVKALLEKNIRGVLSEDKPNDQSSGYYGPPGRREKNMKFQEDTEKGEEQPMPKKDEMEFDVEESLAGMFPQLSEAEPDPEKEMEMETDQQGSMGQIPTLGEEPFMPEAHEEPDGDECPVKEAKKDKGEEEEEEMDEMIEISEAELKKVYESSLKTEVTVKKAFGDIVGGGELEQAAKETGILDKKSGEKQWSEEEPPAKQDFTVKEIVRRGLAENKKLRESLGKAITMIEQLGTKLHEVNLFNAKVLHVNKILNAQRLTKEQKMVVMNSIDKARSISEVKIVYEVVLNSFNASKNLAESKNPRRPLANAQRARTSGGADPKVLRESVDKADNNEMASRMQQLAGLVK